MRKFKEKDFADPKYCSSVRMSYELFKDRYRKCKPRSDLPKENGFVTVLVPYERIATDAALEVMGVNTDADQYPEAYCRVANETLRQDVTKTRASLEARKNKLDSDRYQKMSLILKIVEAYQDYLRKRGLTFPDPLQPPAKTPVYTTPTITPEDTPKTVFEKVLRAEPTDKAQKIKAEPIPEIKRAQETIRAEAEKAKEKIEKIAAATPPTNVSEAQTPPVVAQPQVKSEQSKTEAPKIIYKPESATKSEENSLSDDLIEQALNALDEDQYAAEIKASLDDIPPIEVVNLDEPKTSAAPPAKAPSTTPTQSHPSSKDDSAASSSDDDPYSMI